MLKRVLTLFAILTGLAAVAAPVQARASLLEEVSVHAARESGTKCADKRIGDQALATPSFSGRKAQAPACQPPVITIVIPTVMLKVDRSRE